MDREKEMNGSLHLSNERPSQSEEGEEMRETTNLKTCIISSDKSKELSNKGVV